MTERSAHAAPRAGSAGEAPSSTSLGELARGLLADLETSVRERARIAVLEARLAAVAASHLIALAVAAGVLSATCWLLAVAVLVSAIATFGVSWPVATLLGLTVNAGAVWFVWRAMSAKLSRISFQATMASFEGLLRPPAGTEVTGQKKDARAANATSPSSTAASIAAG